MSEATHPRLNARHGVAFKMSPRPQKSNLQAEVNYQARQKIASSIEFVKAKAPSIPKPDHATFKQSNKRSVPTKTLSQNDHQLSSTHSDTANHIPENSIQASVIAEAAASLDHLDDDSIFYLPEVKERRKPFVPISKIIKTVTKSAWHNKKSISVLFILGISGAVVIQVAHLRPAEFSSGITQLQQTILKSQQNPGVPTFAAFSPNNPNQATYDYVKDANILRFEEFIGDTAILVTQQQLPDQVASGAESVFGIAKAVNTDASVREITSERSILYITKTTDNKQRVVTAIDHLLLGISVSGELEDQQIIEYVNRLEQTLTIPQQGSQQ